MRLTTPDATQPSAVEFVGAHLEHLVTGPVEPSLRYRGGQSHADAALAAFDVTHYYSRRNEVYPQPKRGASGLSPYIRHGLLDLPTMWDAVAGGPAKDVKKFRDELMWQEFARHWYARLGRRTGDGILQDLPHKVDAGSWNRDMACIELTVDELEEDGWLVNQTRMWLASEWAVRRGLRWQDGEDEFFRHLLDGSRAANRLGWQWTIGTASRKPYGFSRWQVEKRAPSLCASCDLVHACPIEDWPEDSDYAPTPQPVTLRGGAQTQTNAGPSAPEIVGEPDTVWLTAESLGSADAALAAHPDLPVVFVFDEPLLQSLQLSAKRLIFLTEILAELGQERDVELHLGRPADVFVDRQVAVTHAPVPGFARRARAIAPVAVYPWPWLTFPKAGSIESFSAWRKTAKR